MARILSLSTAASVTALWLARGVAACRTGSFYIPDLVTSGNMTEMLWDFDGGAKVGAGMGGGSVAFNFGDAVTFSTGQADASACASAGAVLEITFNVGMKESGLPDVDFKLTVADNNGMVLHEWYHEGDGYDTEGGITTYIPLQGADSTSFTISLAEYEDSVGVTSPVPAMFLGSVAAIWIVGELDENEQVLVMDMAPYMYGDCTLGNITSSSGGVSFFRGDDYILSSTGDCYFALDWAAEAVERLQAPAFMEVSYHGVPGEYSYVRIITGSASADIAFQWTRDYDSDESSYVSLQIPGHFLVNTNMTKNATLLAAWDGQVSSGDTLPGSPLLGNGEGGYVRYAKFQGSSYKVSVLDLSRGDFVVGDGAVKGVDADDVSVDNFELKVADGYSFPLGPLMKGNFTFDAPVSDVPYLLDVVTTRLDSDSKLEISLEDAVTGAVVAAGTLWEYEDDASSTTKHTFYVSQCSSGKLAFSWLGANPTANEGIQFSPFFVVRQLGATSTTSTATSTTATSTTTTSVTITETTSTGTETSSTATTTATTTTSMTATMTTVTATSTTVTSTTSTTTTTTARMPEASSAFLGQSLQGPGLAVLMLLGCSML